MLYQYAFNCESARSNHMYLMHHKVFIQIYLKGQKQIYLKGQERLLHYSEIEIRIKLS